MSSNNNTNITFIPEIQDEEQVQTPGRRFMVNIPQYNALQLQYIAQYAQLLQQQNQQLLFTQDQQVLHQQQQRNAGGRNTTQVQSERRRANPQAPQSEPRQQLQRENPTLHPQFKSKAVCDLSCNYCSVKVCKRGMKAILLGNTNIELFSTDFPPKSTQLVENDYRTTNCCCRIKDVACLTWYKSTFLFISSGNVIGYHVIQPCDFCLRACNNGHFWMFLSGSVCSSERTDEDGNILLWGDINTLKEESGDVLRTGSSHFFCQR